MLNRMLALRWFGLVLVLAPGCATSLSSFQPAHIAPKGHVSAEAGMDASIPTGTIDRTVDTGKTLARAAQTRMLSEDEKLQVFAAGLNLSLNPPFFVEHAGLNYVFADNWEAGLRYASSAWRLGIRRQLMTQDRDGYDVTIGVGVQRFSFGFPIDNVIDIIKLDDFVRWNLDIPVAIGRRTDYLRWWAGPRMVFSTYSTRLEIEAPQTGGAVGRDVAEAAGRGAYLGAQAGAAVGYRWLFVALEMTIVRMVGDAHIDVFGRRTEADTGTWIIYPGIAVLGEF
jgi:hypothetical protein